MTRVVEGGLGFLAAPARAPGQTVKESPSMVAVEWVEQRRTHPSEPDAWRCQVYVHFDGGVGYYAPVSVAPGPAAGEWTASVSSCLSGSARVALYVELHDLGLLVETPEGEETARAWPVGRANDPDAAARQAGAAAWRCRLRGHGWDPDGSLAAARAGI